MSPWFSLALRNVLRNSRRSLLLGGTVATGCIALLLFAGYIASSLYGLRESTIRGGLGHLHVAAAGQFDGYADQQLQYGLSGEAQTRLSELLTQSPLVRRIAPRLEFGGLVSNGPRTLNFQGYGVEPSREKQAFGSFQTFAAGHALSNRPDQRYQVLLGKELARRLNVKPGDSVTLMTTTTVGSINAMDLEVTGLVATGIPETELYLLQMPLTTAQELLRTDKISYLAVLLNETADTDLAMQTLPPQWGPGVEARTWQQLAPVYEQVYVLYRNQFIVFGIIIAVVAFLSVATMTLTTIYERAREIGTLRATGISASTIRRLFMLEGLLQGALGAAAGIFVAWLAGLGINACHIILPPPPGRNMGVLLTVLWQPSCALAVALILPVIAMLAAWLTSARISRLPIVEALASH